MVSFGIPGVSDPMGFETNVQALESADVEVAGGSEVGWLTVHGFLPVFCWGIREKARNKYS